MPPHSDRSTAHRSSQAGPRGLAAAVLLAGLVLGPLQVTAGEVTGTVTLDGRPVPGANLVLRHTGGGRGTITVRLDERSSYHVFLEPGRYEATLSGAPSALPVRSVPAPVRQDLRFVR